jgi:AraC family transcriptional activator FtrA
MPIEEVGAAVGFESPVTFRHHFARAMQTSPSAYRRTFRTEVGLNPHPYGRK